MVSINVEYVHDNIKKFIDELDEITKASVLHALNELSILGNELKFPLSKYIGFKLFELRITKPMNVRILYTFYNNQTWILNIFKKKSQKIPKREIELALQRSKMLID
jgi:phage-related protein